MARSMSIPVGPSVQVKKKKIVNNMQMGGMWQKYYKILYKLRFVQKAVNGYVNSYYKLIKTDRQNNAIGKRWNSSSQHIN